MSVIKCFKCGEPNSSDIDYCEHCGEKLFGAEEYSEKIEELKAFRDYRGKYNIIVIIIIYLFMLMLYPLLKWLEIISPLHSGFLSIFTFEYIPLTVSIIFLLLISFQMIRGRYKIYKRYHWSRKTMHDLDHTIKVLPEALLTLKVETLDGNGKQPPARKSKGLQILPLAIIFVVIGIFYTNNYTDFKPMDDITSFFGITGHNTSGDGHKTGTGNYITVEGKYICHMEEKQLEKGVIQSEQTWSYVFNLDGTYTSYMDGYQQFSGTWSQSGKILTINTPAIGSAIDARSDIATVSSDGESFINDENVFTKVR